MCIKVTNFKLHVRLAILLKKSAIRTQQFSKVIKQIPEFRGKTQIYQKLTFIATTGRKFPFVLLPRCPKFTEGSLIKIVLLLGLWLRGAVYFIVNKTENNYFLLKKKTRFPMFVLI